jgi:anaerobic ribonucleoside-triphosphate reductase
MYNLSEFEEKEIQKIEKQLFYSNGVMRYSKKQILEDVNLSISTLKLKYLYKKMEELKLASWN